MKEIKHEPYVKEIKHEPYVKEIKYEPIVKEIKSEPSTNEIDIKSKYQNCPICLCNFRNNTVIANPNVCEHVFCLDCLQEWSKKINTCPIDRKIFSFILIKNNSNQIIKKVKVEDRTQSHREEHEQDLTFCEVCRQPNREDRMLLCDACDKGYHCECLNPQIDEIPEGEWFCPECIIHRLAHNIPSTSNSNFERRVMARTNFSERVRRNVSANRRNLSERRIKKTKNVKRKSNRRKKVKRIRKTANLKTAKASTKSLKIVKKYKRTRNKSSLKGKNKTKILTRKTTRKRRLSRKKIKILKISPEERILKKILDQDQKKEKISDICANLSSSFRVRSLNDEDYASIQLTSQTSQYFENNDSNKSQELKEEKKASGSYDLLNSIINSQNLLSKSSTNLKLNHDGSMELININSHNQFKIKEQKLEIHDEPKLTKFNLAKAEIHDFKKVKLEKSEKNELKNEPVEKSSEFNRKKELNLPKLEQFARQEVKFNPKTEIFDFSPNFNLKKNKSDTEKYACKRKNVENISIKREPKDLREKQVPKVDIPIFDNLSKCKSEPTVPKSELKIKFKQEKIDSNQNESIKSNAVVPKTDCIQEQIALICKGTLKPYFVKNKISKEDYKMIMKKVVNKVRARVKNVESINTKKVIDLTLAYISRTEKPEQKNLV